MNKVIGIHRVLVQLAVVLCLFKSNAQDIHFSHSEYSPLTLNPALMGANSPMQAIINYRNQWSSVGVPFQTSAVSFDARFNEQKRRKKGIIAGGFNFVNDVAGSQRMTTNIANLSLAYHLIIDRESTIGLGLFGGFGQRSFSTTGGQWMSQYDGVSYNANASSNENFLTPTFKYFDVGAGMVYAYNVGGGHMTKRERKRLNVGFAAYHLNRPYSSFLNQKNERLSIRYTAFINADIGLENSNGIIQPGFYFQRQAGHQEIMMGANYGYTINSGSRATGFTRPMTFYLGMFYRLKDAFVARVMIEYDVFSLGFAYDVNLSDLTPVTKTVGGFEFFLRFNMGDGGGFRSVGKINRIRF